MEKFDEILNEWRKSKSSVEFKKTYPQFFNSWRAFRYTEKGKKIGNSPEWDDFNQFIEDMFPTYEKGLRLGRIDKNKPFSKENCRWLTDSELALTRENAIKITYNGETKTAQEWAELTDNSVAGIKLRYHRHKEDYTPEEIIYGKKRKRGDKPVKDWKTSNMTPRQKASKMISAYKNKDKKMGFDNVCDITIDWMLDNIANKPCVYCGDTNRVGCDRIDNNKPHTIDNVVPCCYECNCARNKNFSYDEMKIIGKAIKEVKNNRQILQSSKDDITLTIQ